MLTEMLFPLTGVFLGILQCVRLLFSTLSEGHSWAWRSMQSERAIFGGLSESSIALDFFSLPALRLCTVRLSSIMQSDLETLVGPVCC